MAEAYRNMATNPLDYLQGVLEFTNKIIGKFVSNQQAVNKMKGQQYTDSLNRAKMDLSFDQLQHQRNQLEQLKDYQNKLIRNQAAQIKSVDEHYERMDETQRKTAVSNIEVNNKRIEELDQRIKDMEQAYGHRAEGVRIAKEMYNANKLKDPEKVKTIKDKFFEIPKAFKEEILNKVFEYNVWPTMREEYKVEALKGQPRGAQITYDASKMDSIYNTNRQDYLSKHSEWLNNPTAVFPYNNKETEK